MHVGRALLFSFPLSDRVVVHVCARSQRRIRLCNGSSHNGSGAPADCIPQLSKVPWLPSPQQYQQLIDRISELETRMVTLHNHAEAQQEQIRVPPQPRTAPKQVTEGGAFKALARYTGNPSEYHHWAFSARRVVTRANERFGGLVQWISGQIHEIKESDVLEYRRTAGLSTTDIVLARSGDALATGHQDGRHGLSLHQVKRRSGRQRNCRVATLEA